VIRVVCAYGGVRCGSVCCMWLPVLLKSAHLCPHFLNILHLLKAFNGSFVCFFIRQITGVSEFRAKSPSGFFGKNSSKLDLVKTQQYKF
jgi:hypothetical protein